MAKKLSLLMSRKTIQILLTVWYFSSTATSRSGSNNKTCQQWNFEGRIPKNAWDSHVHVVDPIECPLAENAAYVPQRHQLDDLLSFQASVGFDNAVLVQPSIYGYDNTCMLNALRQLGPRRGRAVVTFEPSSISTEILQQWHELGVRGVRINLSSVGEEADIADLRRLLLAYAEDCRPLNWIIQLYVPMRMIPDLEPIIPQLGVRVCFDHMGDPDLGETPSKNPYEIQGFRSLKSLLEGGSTFVKLSAPYRISNDTDYSDLEPLAKELIRVAGRDRVMFATDWPHTRFEGLDITPWIDEVLNWCKGDQVLVDRLFRGNAEDFWNS
ncbi:2-pyrone-4,6-dicarbaxylate hydrolase [Paramyrothecium foliicola]|nr:2-pyrone-4,6-dicarbaxylate hydrolase [Paramyrothecium foliicola]